MEIDVPNSLTKPGLFEKFKAQVYRDFELAGCVEFIPDIVSNNLSEIETGFLNSLSKLDSANLLKPLLYRVDITELQIKKASQQHQNAPLQHVLTQLMIKRILQKVVLKELYSK